MVDERPKVCVKHLCLCIHAYVFVYMCVGVLMVASNIFAYDFYSRRVAWKCLVCGQIQIGDVFFSSASSRLGYVFVGPGLVWCGLTRPILRGEVWRWHWVSIYVQFEITKCVEDLSIRKFI